MRVLVVDDSALMRQLLVASLQAWDHEALSASNGAEAWELFQREQVPLVLTDWMMPEVDGLELIRRIRGLPLSHYVYIVLLTGRSDKEDLVEAMEAGADDFVAKPIDQGELRVRVQQGERMIRLERTLADQNQRLRETQAALVQSEKLASVGQLAAGMAHEINNPIAFVTNNLCVLKRDVSSLMELVQKYHQGQHCLRDAAQLATEISQFEADCELDWIAENLPTLFSTSLDGLARVRKIVLNLRSFAHLDEAELNQLDLAAACRSVLEVLNHEIKAKQLHVAFTAEEPLRPVLCQPSKIKQVIHNLLLNAVQASTPGGAIAMRLHEDEAGVQIEIEDHGCGIAPAILPRIFEPFFTTRPVGQGAGLGLAMSYGIVRDHGGAIEVDSQPGQGSTFRLRLPWQPPVVLKPLATAS